MKYIKMFNESKEEEEDRLEEVKQFCEESLIDLIDKGYYLIIRYTNLGKTIKISLSNVSFFRWHDVKDNIIPFLDILNDNYTVSKSFTRLRDDTLCGICIYDIGFNKFLYSVKEIMEDDIKNDTLTPGIDFYINKKRKL